MSTRIRCAYCTKTFFKNSEYYIHANQRHLAIIATSWRCCTVCNYYYPNADELQVHQNSGKKEWDVQIGQSLEIVLHKSPSFGVVQVFKFDSQLTRNVGKSVAQGANSATRPSQTTRPSTSIVTANTWIRYFMSRGSHQLTHHSDPLIAFRSRRTGRRANFVACVSPLWEF